MQFIRIQLNILQSATNPVRQFSASVREVSQLPGDWLVNSNFVYLPFFSQAERLNVLYQPDKMLGTFM